MTQRESGFTIIETTLVLAITGLIVAVILAGIGNSLNHQRYTDAVNQAVDFIRGQYTVGANTQNDRSNTERCTTAGIQDTGAATTGTPLGTSDCLLVGTIMRTNGTDGKSVSVYQVVALADPGDSMSGSTDTELLAASQLTQGNRLQTYQPEWDTRFLNPDPAEPAQFTILVVRTPVSGTMRTYSSDSGSTSIADLLNSPQEDRKLCIDQTGFFGMGIQPMGILIVRGTANTTGVQVLPSGECVA